ncbi:nectin-3-like [Mauremys mutica]|nr:nectin-3-like [Mauremys mutica]XP_044852757.1 nectin-3-like [Mauremys mutica]
MGWLEASNWQLHVSLIVLLSIHMKGALVEPVVDPHVTAVWGKNVTLKCIIEINGTITQISWEKMHGKSKQTIAVHHPKYGFTARGDYQGRVSLKNYSLTDATITLNNISFSDSGEYICKAVTFPLGNAQSSTTVTVLVEPIVSLTKGPNSLIDGENQTVAAICTAATGKPAADIDWEGGLGEVESSSTLFPNETVTVVSQYKLIPTKFSRGRLITCVVKHPTLEKEMRYPYTLDILYAPEVSVTGYDGNWFIGREHVQLQCNAGANPPPTEFTWTRLDGQWPEGLMSSNNTLHFNSRLTYNYTGTYVCKVTNSLGQRNDQQTIYILEYPGNETAVLEELVFGSGDTLELSCNTQGSSMSVFWFKDGIGIAPTNRTHIRQKLLKIINVSSDDSGLYSCKPRHSSEVLGNFTVRVTDSPSLVVGGDDESEDTGDGDDDDGSEDTDPPTTITQPPTVPWHPSTDGIRASATEPELMHFPTSTLSPSIAGNRGISIASAVGGALFLIVVSVWVGVICYRRIRKSRHYYFVRTRNTPSDMDEESQIAVFQPNDVDSSPDIIKERIDISLEVLTSNSNLEDPDKPDETL